MVHQSDLSAEAVQSLATTGRSYTIARVISQIFHPITLGTLSFFLVGLFATPDWRDGMAWALFCFIIQVAPATVFFLVRLRQGVYSDEDISVRHQRNELYIFTILTMVLGTVILIVMRAPLPFSVIIGCGALLNTINWIINMFWKISAHATVAASFATIALIYSPPLGAVLWVGALAVGWARVRTRNHTPLQVLAGLSLPTLLILTMFSAIGLL
jgi:membrane-associated phospholipid phosphatase